MWLNKKLPENLTEREKDKLTAFIGYSYSDMNLVGQYENAINILINQIVQEKSRIDVIAYPLLYLMRHTIELALKENIKYLKKYSKLNIVKLNTHTLTELVLKFETHYNKIAVENNFETELNKEFTKYLTELKLLISELGIDASSFRYIYSSDGTKIFNSSTSVKIYELKEKFDNSIIFLTHTADAISQYTDYIDYLKFDKTVEIESLGIVLYCFDKYQKDWLIEKLNEKHKIVKTNLIWYDETEKYFLHLKIVNKKCYVLPMKK